MKTIFPKSKFRNLRSAFYENVDFIRLKKFSPILTHPNDCAVAIAEHLGGSVEGFSKMMNDKAMELGCKDTIFETPNGLDKGEHHSTARDMAIITRYCLENEQFIEYTNTPVKTIKTSRTTYTVNNKNRLLTTYDGANGVKTGFTNKAGQCFIGSAKRGDMQLITVVLASGWGDTGKERKWTDTKNMLDYGFGNYKYYTVLDGEKKLGEVKVLDSKVENLEVYETGNIIVPMTEEEANGVKLVPKCSKEIKAPVVAGQVVGKLEVYVLDEVVGIVDIYTKAGAELNTFEYNFKKVFSSWFEVGNELLIIK